MISIAKVVADAAVSIETIETQQEQELVDSFVKSHEESILAGICYCYADRIFYDELILKLKEEFAKSKLSMKHCNKIRAYLRMANLKKKRTQV